MRKIFIGFDANGRKLDLTEEQRAGHMHVIGSSGSGKSKFLEWITRQDIRNGPGFCLIDPHGSLYKDVVQWCGYHYIKDRDIILLDPSSGDYVKGFNPFVRSEGDISVQVDYQITATIRAWGLENTDETPTLERWLRCIYQTLNETGETIVAAEYLIDYFESEVREYLTSSLSNRMMRGEWKGLSSSKTAKQFHDEILSTKNKLLRFLSSEQVYRFMGMRENNINIRQIMDEGKILLVNLAESEHLSHYNARLFGALLVNEIFQQAKRRGKDEYGNPPRPFYLYIDEFQNFVSSDIAYILDQARKFGLFLILAHQRFGHLREEDKDLMDAVLTNVKTRVVLGGLRRADAKLMTEEMFVDQLDLKQIKKAIYQTKFWPVYGRDKVYASTSSYSEGHSELSSVSSGLADHMVPAEGVEGWFDIPNVISTTESEGDASGEGDFFGESWAESEIDIPIFYPVPFEELSSLEYWSLEEQIWRMSDALKKQFPRHCFIQTPGRKTQPMLIPFVKEYYLSERDLSQYQLELYTETKALPKAEVDELLKEERERLEVEAKYKILEEEPREFSAKPIKLPKEKAEKIETEPKEYQAAPIKLPKKE